MLKYMPWAKNLKSQQCFVLRTESSVYAMLNKCTFFVVQHACDTENRIQKERMSLFVFFVIIAKHREGIQNYNSFLLKIYEMAYCLYSCKGYSYAQKL